MSIGRPLRACAAFVLVSAAAWVNYANLSEAYGAGPPYFSGTTNMDKWESPLPFVAALDAAALLIAALLFAPEIRRRGRN